MDHDYITPAMSDMKAMCVLKSASSTVGIERKYTHASKPSTQNPGGLEEK